jgi:predicted GNAT family N-acyltransferase
MAKSDWKIEPFDRERHDRKGFDSGVALLNDWLATKASQFEKKNLSRIYVLVEPEQATIRGYYALSNHSVTFESLPEVQAKGLPQMDVPVVLLGRLAVDLTMQGQKLGEFLLVDALRRADYLSQKIGIRAVEVDAMNSQVRRFYAKFGFVPLRDDPNHLFLPIHVIRKLNLPPI